ncbi:hypothetical protein [Sporolituus thermophilus]|uniref:Uncharacterized protein n=1 Tax=Sporolituus thermophilus DSM 23256 TaxID=1123285 RepID=A0A1G7M089_9FIRM|nr:hypothetical protein [Sporolituus thermophilus]SDF55071.1 hypothetical protein SAMN05660235_01971 [Sporolituus thermophilus DSM 23256]
MQLIFEWVAQHAIDVTPGSFFASAILSDGAVMEESRGRDDFQLHGVLLPRKRVAGFGRQEVYQLDTLPAGLSTLEAVPSQPLQVPDDLDQLTFEVNTNMFYDQGLFSHYLSLRISKDSTYQEIPLSSPVVAVDWPSRGVYRVKVKPFLRAALWGGERPLIARFSPRCAEQWEQILLPEFGF